MLFSGELRQSRLPVLTPTVPDVHIGQPSTALPVEPKEVDQKPNCGETRLLRRAEI